MKLTKAIVEVLKYHGYMTFTESAETFLKRFNTVEELGDAGFITDRGAVNFLKTIFDEDGVNRSAEVSEEELNKQAVIEPEVLGPEKINPEPIGEPEHTPEPEPEPTDEQGPSEEPAPEPEKEPDPVVSPPDNVDDPSEKGNETVIEERSDGTTITHDSWPSEEVKEPEPESAPAEKPKKTTGRKSTKKES